MAGELVVVKRNEVWQPPGFEERVLPANIDIEQVVLGGLMMANTDFGRVSDVLTPETFFETFHGQIYEVAAKLIGDGKPANPLTMVQYLPPIPATFQLTTKVYLARLAAAAPPSGQLREYALMLHELFMRRKMISVALTVLDHAYTPTPAMPARAIADLALDGFGELRTAPGEVQGFVDFDSASMGAVTDAQEAYNRDGRLVGLSTGLPSLDNAIGGLQAPDLIILAGRPGMGKTALATNIAFHVAKDAEARRARGESVGGVGFFSLEMSEKQLAARIISEQARVPGWKIRRGLATRAEMENYVEARADLRRIPLWIDPTGAIPLQTLRVRARNLKKRRGLSLIVVDYLQLVTTGRQSNNRYDTRTQELSDITGGLKELAKDLEVPIIALSQLSRDVEKRDDKRPQLSDLRESGSIEQDADIVLMLYRHEYYMKEPSPKGTEQWWNWRLEEVRYKGIAEAIIAKNRHGPATTVELGFDGSVTRFLNEPEERELEPERPEVIKKRKMTLSKQAIEALGVLRTLSLNHAVPNKDLERVPPRVRPVPARLWLERCAEELLMIDRTPEKVKSVMEKVFLELRQPGSGFDPLVGRGGTKEEPYVWLTEAGQDV